MASEKPSAAVKIGLAEQRTIQALAVTSIFATVGVLIFFLRRASLPGGARSPSNVSTTGPGAA